MLEPDNPIQTKTEKENVLPEWGWGADQTVLQLYIHLCISLDVDFEMLKHSHMEKIHHFVVYASEYTNICLQMSGEPGAQSQAHSNNVLRGLWLML